jgi:hypothetical protein
LILRDFTRHEKKAAAQTANLEKIIESQAEMVQRYEGRSQAFGAEAVKGAAL